MLIDIPVCLDITENEWRFIKIHIGDILFTCQDSEKVGNHLRNMISEKTRNITHQREYRNQVAFVWWNHEGMQFQKLWWLLQDSLIGILVFIFMKFKCFLQSKNNIKQKLFFQWIRICFKQLEEMMAKWLKTFATI